MRQSDIKSTYYANNITEIRHLTRYPFNIINN